MKRVRSKKLFYQAYSIKFKSQDIKKKIKKGDIFIFDNEEYEVIEMPCTIVGRNPNSLLKNVQVSFSDIKLK